MNYDNLNYKEKLNTILKDMPGYVYDYFNYCDGTLNRSVKTMIGYAYDLRTFFDYMLYANPSLKCYNDITMTILNQVSCRDVQEYLSYLRQYQDTKITRSNTASSRSRKLSSLRSFMQYHFVYGMLDTNPAKLVDTPHIPKKKLPYLNDEEVLTLIDNTSSTVGFSEKQTPYLIRSNLRDTAIVILFLYTGIRVSELSNIDLDDIDRKEKQIHIVTKGGNDEYVLITDEILSVIDDYINFERVTLDDANRALFVSSRGTKSTRLTTRSIERIIKKFGETVSTTKKITPHTLRRTFGTKLYDKTNDIYLVAEILHHSNIQVTADHYTNISEQNKKRVRDLKYDT